MSDKRSPRFSQSDTTGHQAPPEVLRVRVAFVDTDAMGVAYHGAYLRWFEMARTELLRPTGLPYPALIDRGIHLPVIEALLRYRKPARYDDLLIVRVGRVRAAGVRLRIDYRIECAATLIVEGHTEHAFTDAAGRVLRPPGDVQEIFARLTAAHGG
jgi:acyl-CoA thioester hydrolase